ncbi:hypothetical protein GCM10007940_29850 [Portibacter lacus]|uniref:RNA polymerase subunit sigma-70 n=2 Tax=Portibacter lacus TaxID=1099794 RepID=A0AA37SRT0_9BACT|nr:hypothetical protein GCM10007940_29850 [Portibacter lacus]
MVEMYSDDLFNICCRYVQDQSFAKDCLQESWIQIFWNLDKYKEEGKWESWIKMVTINKCKEMLRKEGKWKVSAIDHIDECLDSNVEDLIIEEENVNMFLDKLPQRYRMVVNLYLVEGYNHKEIAAFLEITESSSRSLLSRALKLLKDAFKEPDQSESIKNTQVKRIRNSIYKKAII